MEQYHQECTQDSADAADQDHQPAVANSQTCYGISDIKDNQPHYGINYEILEGSQDQECAKDYGYE